MQPNRKRLFGICVWACDMANLWSLLAAGENVWCDDVMPRGKHSLLQDAVMCSLHFTVHNYWNRFTNNKAPTTSVRFNDALPLHINCLRVLWVIPTFLISTWWTSRFFYYFGKSMEIGFDLLIWVEEVSIAPDSHCRLTYPHRIELLLFMISLFASQISSSLMHSERNFNDWIDIGWERNFSCLRLSWSQSSPVTEGSAATICLSVLFSFTTLDNKKKRNRTFLKSYSPAKHLKIIHTSSWNLMQNLVDRKRPALWLFAFLLVHSPQVEMSCQKVWLQTNLFPANLIQLGIILRFMLCNKSIKLA